MRWLANYHWANEKPRHSPALSVRAAAGEMMFAASRRDLHGTTTSVGPKRRAWLRRADRLEHWKRLDARASGQVRLCRSQQTFTTKQSNMCHVSSGSARERGRLKLLEQAPATGALALNFFPQNSRSYFFEWISSPMSA